MTYNKITAKKVILRGTSIILMIFAILFGITWKKSGYCIGDDLLTGLGLKAWSNGTSGTHYTALCSLAVLLFAFMLYSVTSKNRLMTFGNFLVGFTVVSLLSSFIF